MISRNDKKIDILLERPSIEEQLLAYDKEGRYPLHMPGHKRLKKEKYSPSEIDVTEVDGTDNLHHPTEMLAEGMTLAATLYGVEHAYYLVNGSTGGLLAAIDATTRIGDYILVARNCHKSVYNGVALKNLKVQYLWPTENSWGLNGAINPEDVEKVLKESANTKVVVVTSPTYDGVCSDTKRIAQIVHKYQGILIVDSAHGAHLGFCKAFPDNEVEKGADLVIVSAHKTLSAYTQSALLFKQGDKVDIKRLEESLRVFQSSSPSYILMAGLDRSIRELATSGERLMLKLHKHLEEFVCNVKNLEKLHLLTAVDLGVSKEYYDQSKILISTKNCAFGEKPITGEDLIAYLRQEWNIELEMAAPNYVVALTSYRDTQEGLERLARGLKVYDSKLTWKEDSCVKVLNKEETEMFPMTIYEAKEADKLDIVLLTSQGYISGEFVYLYPPGIPIIVPGQRLTKEVLAEVERYMDHGMSVEGLSDYTNKWIKVVK